MNCPISSYVLCIDNSLELRSKALITGRGSDYGLQYHLGVGTKQVD